MNTWKPEIQWRNPESLTPYARNAMAHPTEQIDELAGQIAAVGFTQPIVVDKDGVIVVGHGRREAAMRLGLSEVPVVVADHLDEHQLMAYRIADNKVREKARWDFDMLKFELGSLERNGFNLELTGFSLPDLKTLLPKDPGQGDSGGQREGSPDSGGAKGSSEMSEGDFQEFKHVCPKCGFGFDGA